jgi:glutathione S-transferase/3-isopropylmalate dehydratase
MVESGAIAEYVIGRYGPTPLAPPSSDPAFPLYQQFLHLGEAGLASYLNIVVASRFFAPDDQKDNFGAQVAVRLFMSRLDLVTRRLAVSPYLAGEHFTAADISVVYALEMGQRLGLADRYAPAIADYMERLALRDCYKRAVEKSRP